MNTVRSDKIVYVDFNKIEFLKEDKRALVLVLSENQYLIGIFQGYCHVAGCKMETLPLNNVDVFIKTLKKESPSVVFIDMTQATQIFSSPEWTTTWNSIQENSIAFCGIGKQPPNNDETVPRSVFNKVFAEPLNIDEIEDFLDDRMAADALIKYERRSKERREGEDRRKLFMKHEATSFSVTKYLNNGDTSNNELNSEQRRCIGALVIDYLAKTITVNGVVIESSPKEFQFIDLLAQRPGCVIKTEDILKKVWPENGKATNADVHQYVYILRNKLEENPHKPKLLVTVKGFGYKLSP